MYYFEHAPTQLIDTNPFVDLDWHDHINQLLLGDSQRAGLLRWMSKDLRPSTVQQLYVYFLRPKLEYACPVWHGALLERDAIALERVQGAVARSILRAPFHTSKSKLFEQLNWPSLRWRREIFCIGLFHRIYCTLALLHLIPACFRLHRRTPHALSVNLSS